MTEQKLSDPPEEFPPAARAEWLRRAPLAFARGNLPPLYRGIFAAYCATYGRWAQIEHVLARLPDTEIDARTILRNMAREQAATTAGYARQAFIEPSPRVCERAAEPLEPHPASPEPDAANDNNSQGASEA